MAMALLVACGGDTAEEPAEEAADTTEAADTAEEVADTAEEPAAEEEMAEVQLRWRTRPDNQAEIDVYQSVSNDLDASLTTSPWFTNQRQRKLQLPGRFEDGRWHCARRLLDSRNRRS
ncbi:MAG: hypothetical protein R3D55_13015 [Chloroflexota bacterium]